MRANRRTNLSSSFLLALLLFGSWLAREVYCDSPEVVDLERLVAEANHPDRAQWFPSARELGILGTRDEEIGQRVWREARVNSLGMKFVLIEPGSFSMGPDRSHPFIITPGHRVEIAQAFFMSAAEVTNSQFVQVFPEYVPDAEYSPDPDAPAVKVAWEEAVQFCDVLSKREKSVYRLPTEAEWEYACRAGSKTEYSFGRTAERLSEFAWWNYINGRASPVAMLQPNAWGLYDMHGNAFEWVSDWHSKTYYSECAAKGTVKDPGGPSDGQVHVLRGGGWQVRNDEALTCTFRMPLPVFDRTLLQPDPVGLRQTIGFRVVRLP